ncbi:unnamed protein product [Aphanomyces euteiches]
MVAGTVKITGTPRFEATDRMANLDDVVHRVKDIKLDEGGLKGLKLVVRVNIGKSFQQTNPVEAEKANLNEILNFELANVDQKQSVVIDLLKDGEEKAIASTKTILEELIEGKSDKRLFKFDGASGGIVLSGSFTSAETSKKGPSNAGSSKATNETHASVSRSLSTHTDNTTLWYLHPSFYYNKTKEVYAYTTSFSGIAFVARYGEATLEFVLKRLAPKVATLNDVDKSLVPALSTADSKVDENVEYLLKTLIASQDYLVSTKNGAYNKVSQTLSATSTTVKGTVSSAQAKVSQATSAAVDTAYNLSNSTYTALTDTANKLLAYVPLVNKKATA